MSGPEPPTAAAGSLGFVPGAGARVTRGLNAVTLRCGGGGHDGNDVINGQDAAAAYVAGVRSAARENEKGSPTDRIRERDRKRDDVCDAAAWSPSGPGRIEQVEGGARHVANMERPCACPSERGGVSRRSW